MAVRSALCKRTPKNVAQQSPHHANHPTSRPVLCPVGTTELALCSPATSPPSHVAAAGSSQQGYMLQRLFCACPVFRCALCIPLLPWFHAEGWRRRSSPHSCRRATQAGSDAGRQRYGAFSWRSWQQHDPAGATEQHGGLRGAAKPAGAGAPGRGGMGLVQRNGSTEILGENLQIGAERRQRRQVLPAASASLPPLLAACCLRAIPVS